MTQLYFNEMNLDELRKYVLSHRENIEAFQTYIDRSIAQGRMISIDFKDPDWEENLNAQIENSSQ